MPKFILIFTGLILAIVIVGFVVTSRNDDENMRENTLNNSQTIPAQKSAQIVDGTYEVTPEESSIQWKGYKTLIKEYEDNGTLAIQSGMITVQDGKGQGKFTIDMNSLNVLSTGRQSGESLLERHLKSDDFFSVEKFPTAELSVKEVTPDYKVRGDLTIKDITNEIEFPATIYAKDGLLNAEANISLDRTLWDIRYGSDKFFDNLADNVIGDTFTVSLKLVAKKAE